ncbi:unannotated protein [freshwater metagenome]|uniref:Unannotated protein n=1 Tax=freshwater metagenome TaxID=449393 RepID=A0A6J7D7E5_9ZZZZ
MAVLGQWPVEIESVIEQEPALLVGAVFVAVALGGEQTAFECDAVPAWWALLPEVDTKRLK